MNTSEINMLSELSDLIASDTDIYQVYAGLKKHISQLKEFNIYFYDSTCHKLKDVINNFLPIEDILNSNDVEKLYDNFTKLGNCNYIIDNCEIFSNSFKDNEDILLEKVFIPLKSNTIPMGILEFSLKEKFLYNMSSLKILTIVANQLLLWIQNRLINDRLQTNSDFYDALKNIAKIIETQYELNYIIPLIGEMIDKFISNHLIYVFIKQGSKFNLFWPNACRDKKIFNLINKLKKDDYIISEDRKIGVFPLGNKEILGCIVAHSTIDKLTPKEIEYIYQLSKQSSVTIERANVYAEVLKNATLDALTGLNNRRQFEIRLKQEYASATRQKHPLCTMMIDIDFFKSVNDTYGHSTGDKVLKTVAGVIKEQLREYDIPSRYGGEEFCVLLPQTKIEEANIVAQRLRAAVEKTTIKNSEKINVTISIGLSQLKHGDSPEDIYKRADKALYEAKERGRNRVVVYYE